ncbi:mobilization protein [uncultured Methylibium sp.]|uniref:mobilization protein n=1 Tax=uncultured Methylibium sp. TaxID=381093 RepID=UPI0025EC7449|nr:mobilization protein [uncultured Methylibium sp.]
MSQIPTLEAGNTSKVHLIGGEKGGVGKSLVARLLAQYFIDHQLPFVGYDTDRSHGSLMRFYSGYASPVLVDRYEALDAIVESAIEQPGRRVLVDLAAQTHDPLVKWMDESGVLDLADLSGVAIHYWHVMDAGKDSVDLLKRLLDRFGQRLRYVLVRNQLRGDDFSQLEKSGELARAVALGARVVDIRRLHDALVQKIDASNSSFWAAKNVGGKEGPALGLMERQRLKLWLNHAFGEIAAAGV